MNNKYLLLLLLCIFGFNSFAQQGPAVPFVTAVDGDPTCNPGECTDLNALFFDTGETSSYIVESIPYNPPFAFTGGNVIDASEDDKWSSVIDIFDFCFYGQKYNKILINSNGAITFSVAGVVPGGQYTQGTFASWVLDGTPIPTASGGAGVSNLSIFGVLQDTNPNDTTNPADMSINYQVFGAAPNRVLIFNIYNIKHYACASGPTQTSQMVLYETTNIIEVYVRDRETSCTWNQGRALIGLQKDATTGIAAPGRNNVNFTAHNEAWRFKPNGPSVVSVDWYDGTTLLGSGVPFQVCPDETTTYTAVAKYTMCDGSQVTVSDDVDHVVPEPLPLVDVGQVVLCGDQPSFTVDLTEINDEILNGLDPDVNMLTVYLDPDSANGGYDNLTTSEMTNFVINQGEEYTIYGRIENYFTGCLTFFQYIVKVGVQPTVTEPADMQVCDAGGDNIEIFDLTSNDAVILGTQDPADFPVTYHTTSAGADANDNSIPDATAFSSGNTTVFARVSNAENEDCFAVTSFDLIVTPSPQVTVPADGFACSNVGYTLPPLTVGNYYTASGGAGTQLTAGTVLFASQTVYVYTESGTSPNNCSSEGSFEVTIYPSPDVDDIADLQACDGYELPALTEGNYYTGPGGTGTQLFAGDIITTTQTIYIYAVSGDSTTVCEDESDFLVTINYAPAVSPATPLERCADNADEQTYFDLTVAGAEILNGQTGLTITYHETPEGAEFGTNEIQNPSNYDNLVSPVYASVIQSGTTTNCRSVVPIELIVHPRPAVPVLSDYVLCDDDTDGVQVFDLTTKNTEANGGDTSLTVAYYITKEDALAGQAPISPDTAFSNTVAGTQQIWVGIATTFGCRSVAPLTLRVNPLPVLSDDPNAYIANECEEVPGQAEFHLEEIAA
ncbi:hypothetical protein NHE85_11660, partial [Flavobacterium sp. NRK1]|nr:hypothetical protein [Flavobacterium sp. NRK1]